MRGDPISVSGLTKRYGHTQAGLRRRAGRRRHGQLCDPRHVAAGHRPGPPVRRRRHRVGTNAQLAAGHDRVLVVAPLGSGGGPVPSVRTEASALRRGGWKVLVVLPDKAARTASGRNPSDPSMRGSAARGGRAQAPSVAAAVRDFWGA